MHRIKGLEFQIMFIVAVNKDIIPLKYSQKEFEDEISSEEYIKSEKCLLFVFGKINLLTESIEFHLC